MAIRASRHADGPLHEHLEKLREYAQKVIIDGDALSPEEEADREARFVLFAELGGSCRMTEREMVSLMFRGVFTPAPPCWCSKCRASHNDSH